MLRARGVHVTIVAVTDGENAYKANEGLAELRRMEQTRAVAHLGVAENNVIRLHFVDSGVAAQETELVTKLRPLIHSGTQVFAPWAGDFHPDHEACARAASIAASEAGATLISYFFWTWHRGTPATVRGLDLRKLTLNKELRRAKATALACHASQLTHSPEPEILPENLLWPARTAFEVYAL
jgi:LmbE family N-acetylglucosaminyl deacetylase